MRPLDRLASLKLKLGSVIVAAVVTTLVVNEVGLRWNLKPAFRGAVAAGLALAMVQLLARGMTSPLREMADAARAMERGEHGRRVTATSRDEVGELARAFNAMAAELAEVDRVRRDLVANVSHELRTPITALQAGLENLVDGVSDPDQPPLRPCSARSSGWVDWSPSCSTSVASSRAPCPSSARSAPVASAPRRRRRRVPPACRRHRHPRRGRAAPT